ncbi:DNA polymerase family A-domain-containing protein [Dipodascopsis uninucleata]
MIRIVDKFGRIHRKVELRRWSCFSDLQVILYGQYGSVRYMTTGKESRPSIDSNVTAIDHEIARSSKSLKGVKDQASDLDKVKIPDYAVNIDELHDSRLFSSSIASYSNKYVDEQPFDNDFLPFDIPPFDLPKKKSLSKKKTTTIVPRKTIKAKKGTMKAAASADENNNTIHISSSLNADNFPNVLTGFNADELFMDGISSIMENANISDQREEKESLLIANSKKEGTVKTAISDPEVRINQVGIQQLSQSLHKQIFPSGINTVNEKFVKLSQRHLEMHGLLGKQSEVQPPISLDLPKLQGSSLDEHFYRIGMTDAEPYLSMAKDFILHDLPKRPSKWLKRSGWTKYRPGKRATKVDFPADDCLVFDTEVLYKISPFAVMATAVSKDAWYVWLSPWLLGETENDRQLIPLGIHDKPKLVVGHNVGYDRVRVKDEYSFMRSKGMFLDTMSLHIACYGMCTQQRSRWSEYRKHIEISNKLNSLIRTDELRHTLGKKEDYLDEDMNEPWLNKSAANSLDDVAYFHCRIAMDKGIRDIFKSTNMADVTDNISQLISYCATDTETTFEVYKKVLPRFLQTCPHPVSFAALRHIASIFLPVDSEWQNYITRAESKYQELSNKVVDHLKRMVSDAVELKDTPEKFKNDPWLSQLDWTIKPIRMTKPKKKGEEPRMAKNQKLPGYPEWYKALFSRADGPMNVSVRTRIAPIMFRMSWDGNPLIHCDENGWMFRVPNSKKTHYMKSNMTLCSFTENSKFKNDIHYVYFKVPHKDGPSARCVSPLAKGYLQYFDSGVLSSQYSVALEALKMNAACSYWIGARERISSQVPVWKDDTDLGIEAHNEKQLGMILPTIIPMGTVTRRAVEKTWLTASNAKSNRVGSELKSMIRAPEGYKFVGADVDSEELWIASLVGDSQFGMHGSTAIGFMTLEGTKSLGTDLHSKTASILNISRNHAKVFNYGRIYGAGVKFATQLLQQFDPTISEEDAKKTATILYESTKGSKEHNSSKFRRSYWFGGTESLMFNRLEDIANQEIPKTPVLACAITDALRKGNIKSNGYLTSRVNWAVQSSGVDYLHLLIISMEYLIKTFKIHARLCLTVHDEIRYLVKDEDKYKVALALQISNLWTRAIFCEQLGINDLPQSCAFFSAVDIDHVIRKEVDLTCVTPSHPNPIEPGESLDIFKLLDKIRVLDEECASQNLDILPWEYHYRTPVFKEMFENESEISKRNKRAPVVSTDLSYLRAQISKYGNSDLTID